ncbi:MAG: HAD family hydrolase [Coraliomargarita sp.]
MRTAPYSAVLWDMDGTLIDQTAGILRCFSDVITQMGHARPDPMEIRRSMGGTMRSTMSLFIDQTKLDEACTAFRAHFPQIMLEGLIILPGALECLRRLNAAGIPQGILTNKHGPTARTVAEHCGFSQYLSCCIGNTDTEWNKPDAELTRFALEQIGASTDDSLYIGDSPTDVATARNAGIACYGVSTGAHRIDELLDAGAVKAAESLAGLDLV